MKVVGIDPSSKAAGFGVVDNGLPVFIGCWKPSKKSLAPHKKLHEWDLYTSFMISSFQPDRIFMEVIRVGQSHDVTRIMSRFESVLIINAQRYGIEVIEHAVTQSRLAYYGDGSIKKIDVYNSMRAKYPNLPWLLPMDDKGNELGGMDQSDSLVAALANERLIERQAVVAQEKKAKNARKRAKKQ